jgi:FixJ family two-component response regulator
VQLRCIHQQPKANMSIRVAIVDDDESVCRSLGRLLHVVGLESAGYPSAEAFLADEARSTFDCLVLDIQLGGMSGMELQKRLVAERLPVPIIFITAYDNPGIRIEAERRGCAGYFRKTDPGVEIIAAIRNAAQRAKTN